MGDTDVTAEAAQHVSPFFFVAKISQVLLDTSMAESNDLFAVKYRLLSPCKLQS
ncbi:MAG TPA: hypothetical protein V6D12_17775 [Candidatus Obscuribacterales bacterium]